MGRRSIRREPQVLTVSATAQEILARAGWLTYLNRLRESNKTVAIEFLQNLQEDHSTMRGKCIAVTDDIIAEVTGLPAIGPVWTLKKERLQKIIEIFQDEGQSLTIRRKGVLPAALGEPWAELAKTIQSYITCEGKKDVVRPRHLKLLAVLKQKCSVNLPALLNSLLHDVAQSIKKTQHVESVVSHHGLIQLIVSHSLTQQQSSWEELITMINGGLTTPSPKGKHVTSTPGHPKKWKHVNSTPERPEKWKHVTSTPERPEKRKKLAKRKHATSTPEQPEKRRKSVQLARL